MLVDEVVDAEWRAEARRSAGRQHVIRPGDVVPERFGNMSAEKHRAGVAHARQPPLGALDAELEVLRRDRVGHVDRVLESVDDEDRAEPGQRAPRRLAPRQLGQLPLDLVGHRLCQR
jgi:hypothetical protein